MSDAPAVPASPTAEPSPAAFSYPGFRLYWAARFLAAFGIQVLSVSVAWQIYDLTHDPFLLGLVGLVQFLPSLLLVLVTGTVADRYNRRRIMAVALLVQAACAAAMLALLTSPDAARNIWPAFIVLAVNGTARAFIGPVVQSLVSNLVPPIALPSAIAFNSSSFQLATITGPVAGGLLYGWSATVAFATPIAFFLAAAAMALAIPKPLQRTVPPPVTPDSLLAGFRFIWHNPIVLGAMSLDLVAVLLGGATALLPVFARDVLETGPWGLGLLRSASGIGALSVSIWLMRRPIRDHAGKAMLAAVILFGIGHYGVRAVALGVVVGRRAGGDGRRRHDQRVRAPDADPAAHARRGARPRQRRQHDLHRRLERVGGVPRRLHGGADRRGPGGGVRRRRHYRSGARVDAAVPAVEGDPTSRSGGAGTAWATGPLGTFAEAAGRVMSGSARPVRAWCGGW